MGVNNSSETLSSRLSVYNCSVVTPDWVGTREVQVATCRQNSAMAFQEKYSFSSLLCVPGSFLGKSMDRKICFLTAVHTRSFGLCRSQDTDKGMSWASSEPCTKQQRERPCLPGRLAALREESCPEVGILLLVIDLVHLKLTSVSPQGIV